MSLSPMSSTVCNDIINQGEAVGFNLLLVVVASTQLLSADQQTVWLYKVLAIEPKDRLSWDVLTLTRPALH